ncbi:MAG: serine hydrolase domain-containing protein [Betaproteobacteria bacterium]|nr:beta-lactamase family protein [Rhodocyclaceae bacterium]MCE2899423.1 beta-lactamase family protein [Betaproteobacteria bacterium]
MKNRPHDSRFHPAPMDDASRRQFLRAAAGLGAASALPLFPGAALAQGDPARLQKVLDDSVAANRFPFVVGMTGNASGVTFSGASGDAAPGLKAAPDTVFRIFSMTKAVGSTAAMILIDRGKMSFDTPVQEVLPEFADIQVLDGWDGDKPRLRAPRVKATARHLATHTSGLEYEFWRPEVAEFLGKTKRPSILAGTKDALFYPMTTDPGVRWGYGPSIDWLGLMVEKISGQRIDAFLKANLFEPLGMTDTDVEVRPHMQPRLAAVKARGADGKFGDFPLAPPASPEVYGMGHALYSTPQDYMRFLRMFLNRGTLNGKRVLKDSSVQQMLANQMGPLKFEKMVTAVPPVTADFDPFPGTVKTHSFAFMRNESDIPGRRRAGSQSWAGVLNTHYWFDPRSDLAGIIMTQTLPFVEPPLMAAYEEFEKAAYARA